jgi:hypothetical protein
MPKQTTASPLRAADPNTQAILDNLQISTDRLDGAQEIADYLDVPLERARYLIRARLIPFGREGRNIIASKRALRENYAKVTGVAA